MPLLMRESGIDDNAVGFWKLWMDAVRNNQPSLLAYLSYMVERLLMMHRLMKPTASLYLHCDPNTSHYFKVLLDVIFDHINFRNEIVWHFGQGSVVKSRFPSNHDTILFYSKSSDYQFHRQYSISEDKRRKLGLGFHVNLIDGGRQLIVYDRAKAAEVIASGDYDRIVFQDRENPDRAIDDVWDDISPPNARARERMNYPEQKPLALLERIIKASSSPGEQILDPFCGSATTLEAAQRLDRKWIGIDIALHVITRVAQVRLVKHCGLAEGTDFMLEGAPRTVEEAQQLWEKDKYQFQKWAIEQVGGFCTPKPMGSGDVDGRIYFNMPEETGLQSMLVEVNGGRHVNIRAFRALKSILEHGDAQMAGLIVIEPINDRQQSNFGNFMAQEGNLETNGVSYPRMQILWVEEILEGKQFHLPTVPGRQAVQPRLV